MFSENKKGKMTNNGLTQQNTIAKGTTIVGDVISEGGFRIDGTLKGNLKTTGKVVIGKSGTINGSLEGTNADFEGAFVGKLTLSETLTLRSSANVEGEVVVGKLAVEPGATFNAVCSMRGAVKELKANDQQQKTSKEEQSA